MGFSTIDIEKGLGISRERLREWTAKEFIKPSLPSPGQGMRAEFSREDVLTVCLFDELLKIGFQRKMAGQVVERESQYLWKDSDIARVAPDFMMITFRGENVSVSPIWAGVKMIVDLGDGGKRKLMNAFTGKPIPLPAIASTKFLEEPFDHLHIVNLKAIVARVERAFPE